MQVGDLVWACQTHFHYPDISYRFLSIIIGFHKRKPNKICYVKYVHSGTEHKWAIDDLEEVICE